jgi:hexosaminidase
MTQEVEICLFLDSRFWHNKKSIISLYHQLLHKKVRFVRFEETADIKVVFSPKLKTTFSVEREDPLLILAGDPVSAFQGGMYAARHFRTGRRLALGEKIPRLAERIIMLDIGRKYFSPSFLRQLLDEMALFGFNYLQLHFSENTGLRIESESYPELVSEEHLTREEIRALIHYAADRCIEIIPDLDTPGHMEHLLKNYPEWQLEEQTDYGRQSVPAALDITNQDAVAFVFSLYREYFELFSTSRYFHIGADEFIDLDHLARYPALANNGQEKFEAYVNSVAALVRQAGFIPRIWNDAFFRRGENSGLSKELEITYWTKWQREMAPIQRFLEEGYTVINFNDNYLYYVLGENAGYSYPTADKIEKQWQPELFSSEQLIHITNHEQLKGAAVAVWCDQPEAKEEKSVLIDLIELMEAFSAHIYLNKK